MLPLCSSLDVSLAALYCGQSSQTAGQLTPLDPIFNSMRDHVAGGKTDCPFENISNSFGSIKPKSLSTKAAVCLTFMKVGKKAVNSYLLCQKGLEEYACNCFLSLSLSHFSVTPPPKITEAQRTQSKGLQGFLDLHH